MPSKDWKERIEPGEAERFEQYGQQLRALQKARARGGAAGRGLHLRGHVGAEAEVEVLAGLPEHARAGFFARPGRHRALVRFSNGAGHHQPDRAPDIRGIALKVFDVPGKKVIPPLADATTQDFLFIHSQHGPFKNADEFVALVLAARGSQLLLLPRLAGTVGFGRALQLVKGILKSMGKGFRSFAGRRFYGALPIKYGDYAARCVLVPAGGEGAQEPLVEGGLAADLKERLRREPLVWDLAVQFFVDEAKTPIEDPSRVWEESDSPLVTVGRVTVPVQDADSERGRAISAHVEKLSFDPWHALEEHRPLGNMMRARNQAYRHSTEERGAISELEAAPLATGDAT